MKTISILLFGDSGESETGKSTTINALANYLHYPSFEAAEEGQFVNVIPSQFDPVTNDDLIIEDEKVYENDNSVTQSPKNYEFQYQDKCIRIIDASRIDLTSGLEVYKQNFKNILEYLKTIGELHAICFQIKSISTIETAIFEYSLSEMFVHLPRSASKNIMFCFTFNCNSFYGTGGGYEKLKDFLNENKFGFEKINLQIGENCFFTGNNSFQSFLERKNNNEKSNETQRKYYKADWEKLAQQSLNLINRIVDLEPIKVDKIFALKECRRLVNYLINPIQNLMLKIEEQTNENNFDQKDALVKELEFIRGCTRKLIEFLEINLNTNCQNVIEPYLSLYENDKTKTSNADSLSMKIAKIIIRIRKASHKIVDVNFFDAIKQKLIESIYWENQIREMLKNEEQIEEENLHLVSKVEDEISQLNRPTKPFEMSVNIESPTNITEYMRDRLNNQTCQMRPPEIRPTQTNNRNLSNQTQNNTVHATIDSNFNQVELFLDNSAADEHLIQTDPNSFNSNNTGQCN